MSDRFITDTTTPLRAAVGAFPSFFSWVHQSVTPTPNRSTWPSPRPPAAQWRVTVTAGLCCPLSLHRSTNQNACDASHSCCFSSFILNNEANHCVSLFFIPNHLFMSKQNQLRNSFKLFHREPQLALCKTCHTSPSYQAPPISFCADLCVNNCKR